MANYDDIFNASAQKGTEDKSFVSFNREEWAAQKKQERESAFAMIDETAQRMANDGGLFQSYLDVQARFDRYSVGNAVLITAQKADATQLSDFKGWKNNGVFIKKGESGIVLLEPGEEYTKEDGTVGVSYNSKKVFDISQTTAKAKQYIRSRDAETPFQVMSYSTMTFQESEIYGEDVLEDTECNVEESVM